MVFDRASKWRHDISAMRAERDIESQIRAGNPELQKAGLCLALADWSAEPKILTEREKAAGVGAGGSIVRNV